MAELDKTEYNSHSPMTEVSEISLGFEIRYTQFFITLNTLTNAQTYA